MRSMFYLKKITSLMILLHLSVQLAVGQKVSGAKRTKVTKDMQDKYDQIPNKPIYKTEKKGGKKKKDEGIEYEYEDEFDHPIPEGLEEHEKAAFMEELRKAHKAHKDHLRMQNEVAEVASVHAERERQEHKKHREQKRAVAPLEISRRIERVRKELENAPFDESERTMVRAELEAISAAPWIPSPDSDAVAGHDELGFSNPGRHHGSPARHGGHANVAAPNVLVSDAELRDASQRLWALERHVLDASGGYLSRTKRGRSDEL